MTAEEQQELSLADLEALMNSRKGQLSSLERKRERLAEQLEQVEAEIQSIVGSNGGRSGARRPRNEKSLHGFVVDTLKRYKKGLALADLSDEILKSGYKTNSKNFKNVLYQCLYNATDIQHDESTGKYVLV